MADQEKHGNRPQVTIDGTPLRHDVEVQLERVVVDTSLHAPDLVEVRLRDQGRDVLDPQRGEDRQQAVGRGQPLR